MKYKIILICPLIFLAISLKVFCQEERIIVEKIPAFEYEAIRLELEGVVVCDQNGATKHKSSFKKKFDENSTVLQVVDILGPGYLPKMSGTGTITWFFEDGSKIITELWPESLNSKIKLIYQ